MRLEGIHHITAITGDAPSNVDFYVGVLGLRMVKKTVNQDDPSVYHLFYGDDQGNPGADLTFFEYPGSAPGRAGAGMVHSIGWRVGSPEALSFWERRFADENIACERDGEQLAFSDPEGLRHTLTVYRGGEPPLTAAAPDIPAEHALQGFDGVRAYQHNPGASAALLEAVLGFKPAGEGRWICGGRQRSSYYVYDEPPDEPGASGAGTVHHIAFATDPAKQDDWQRLISEAVPAVTQVIDRFYFQSIYFREPSGVLFELATIGPGFTADEPPEELGQHLSLPPNYEHLREQLAGVLTPLPDPRVARAKRV